MYHIQPQLVIWNVIHLLLIPALLGVRSWATTVRRLHTEGMFPWRCDCLLHLHQDRKEKDGSLQTACDGTFVWEWDWSHYFNTSEHMHGVFQSQLGGLEEIHCNTAQWIEAADSVLQFVMGQRRLWFSCLSVHFLDSINVLRGMMGLQILQMRSEGIKILLVCNCQIESLQHSFLCMILNFIQIWIISF